MKEHFVIDPLISKRQQLMLATQLCRMVLKVCNLLSSFISLFSTPQHHFRHIPETPSPHPSYDSTRHLRTLPPAQGGSACNLISVGEQEGDCKSLVTQLANIRILHGGTSWLPCISTWLRVSLYTLRLSPFKWRVGRWGTARWPCDHRWTMWLLREAMRMSFRRLASRWGLLYYAPVPISGLVDVDLHAYRDCTTMEEYEVVSLESAFLDCCNVMPWCIDIAKREK